MKCSGEVHLCLTLRGDEPCPAAGEGIKRLPRGVYPFDFAQGRPEWARFLAPTSRGSDLSLVFYPIPRCFHFAGLEIQKPSRFGHWAFDEKN